MVNNQLKVNPEVVRRRGLKKFGDATGQSPSDNHTVLSTDEISLERQPVTYFPDTKLFCPSCGMRKHWISPCPFKVVVVGERAGKREGDTMNRHRDDSNSIRVTNLSEDTREQDLQDLFRPFGPISRIYVAFDRETGLSRGFACINFINREDAVKAIKKLDGYGYNNLILRVEWATPKEKC